MSLPKTERRAAVKLIIEIPDDLWSKSKNHLMEYDDACTLVDCFFDGTPLPKGHGRLCDIDAVLQCVEESGFQDDDVKFQVEGILRWAMDKRVMVEADKEFEKEGE